MSRIKPYQKYVRERISKGGECTAKTQEFIFAPAAYHAAEMFSAEILNKAMSQVRKLKINGVRGVISKADVIKVLSSLKKEKFINE